MTILNTLEKQGLIHPPKFLIDNTFYLTIVGSYSYGINNDLSDQDYYGFCIPPRDVVFPHLANEIVGFGRQQKRFEQWSEHNCKYQGKVYDLSIYNIVKYFSLCMENNPNMLSSLYTDRGCVIHSTNISELVRENRKIFLHKGSFFKYKGYAYSQMHKIKSKTRKTITDLVEFEEKQYITYLDFYYRNLDITDREIHALKTKNDDLILFSGKSIETLEIYRKLLLDFKNDKRAVETIDNKLDLKYATHLVRLLLEVEQILIEHDCDLRRNSELLKSIRRGEWDISRLENWFISKEKSLEEVYNKSDLRDRPDEASIKELLLKCLEMHYGSIDKFITIKNDYSKLNSGKEAISMIEKIRELVK